MKRLLSILLALVMTVGLFAACGAEEVNAYTDLTEAYDDELSVYAVAIKEHWGREALAAYGLNDMVTDCGKVGFAKRDIDGDGIPEMIVASMTEGDEFFDHMIFELKTGTADGGIFPVFSSAERDRYYYAGGALFAHNGSSGADDSFDVTEEYASGVMTPVNTVTPVSAYVQMDLEPIVAESEETAFVGMPNPWTDTNREGFLEAGFELHAPLGAENVRYSYIRDDELGQMDFTLDGLDFTARMKPTAFLEDISGMYYDWEQAEPCTISGSLEGEMRRTHEDGKTIDLCIWCDIVPGISYSVCTSGADLDGFDITAIAEMVYVPMQGDAYAEGDTVQFETLGLQLGAPLQGQRVDHYEIEDQGIGEMTFLLDDMECTARIKWTEALEDISGLDCAWEMSEPCNIDYCEGEIRAIREGNVTTQSCVWCDMVPGVSYALNVSGADLDGFDITAIAQQLFVPMQGDAD